jgi:hypothetical protein
MKRVDERLWCNEAETSYCIIKQNRGCIYSTVNCNSLSGNECQNNNFSVLLLVEVGGRWIQILVV